MNTSKIVRYLEEALSQAAGSLTGRSITVASDESATDAPQLTEPITWQQSFSVPEGPALWIRAGRDLWEAMGRITLQTAGIEEVSEEDCRATWQEILNQTAGAVAGALSTAQGREITTSKGGPIDAEPSGIAWSAFTVSSSEAADGKWLLSAGWTKELALLSEAPSAEMRPAVAHDSMNSKTLDLLLEVALPVQVSFGRTSLQIREVLKLNTGSIVELDRFVTDPVEVIVNDCVIARGEVVVVDGNYGVRINELASREDRLRTGMAEAGRKSAR